jgi:tetratricopeptide (TPR) repeat protein
VIARRSISLAVVALAGVLLTLAAGGRARSGLQGEAARFSSDAGFSELALRDEQIRVWNQALAADPRSALALGQLAALHSQRAREGGNWDDFLEAERLSRASLALRTNRNGRSAVTLASALMSQHRFREARDVAKELVAREPDVPQYRSLLGEAAMELGEYELAETMFLSVMRERTHLSIAPRIARWLEVTGYRRDARRLLEAARDEARRRADIPLESRAWFEWRVGDLDLREGRLRRARRAFRRALEIEPGDPRSLAGMARLELLDGRPHEAISWGTRAMAERLEPETLGTIADAHAALGDSSRATEFHRAMVVAASTQPIAMHRALALRQLDRGEKIGAILDAATADLRERRDIYGYDLLAWALHAAGRDAEAVEAIRIALRFGTPDPVLQRHREVIERASLAAER